MHFVPLAVRLGPYFTRLVEELHARQPLFRRELNFSRKIMQMPHGGGEDLFHSRACLRPASVDDMLREVGVVFLLGGHLVGANQKRVGMR